MSEAVSAHFERLDQKTQKLQNTLISGWIKATLVGLCLFLGATLGAWALSKAATSYIRGLWGEVEELEQRKTELEKTLSILEQQTWGIHFMETEQGKFIVLPQKVKATTGWSLNKREAIKLE